jgi:hypothetical protein
VTITVTELAGVNGVINGIFFGTATPPTATATFVKTDTTTQGTWMGTYGSDGYDLVDGPSSLPSYATVSVSGATTFAWSTNTTDVRGLENPASSAPASHRIAAVWYAAHSFTITVDLTGGTHTVALYAADWDNRGRSERIQISDATSGVVLDSETLSSFASGAYEVWNISGDVTITVTELAGVNGVINGIFFGTPTSSSSPISTGVASLGTNEMGALDLTDGGGSTGTPIAGTTIPAGANISPLTVAPLTKTKRGPAVAAE